MFRKHRALLALIATLLATGRAWCQSPAPADFAYGCNLPVGDATGLYRLELPATVYAKLQQPNLSDLQVFNGAGEPVPQLLRPPQPPAEPIRRSIPFFPLPGRDQAPTQDLRVQVQRLTDGSIITINSDTTAASAAAGCSYLLDLSGPSPAPRQLEVQWSAGTGAQMYRVQLWESSNLAQWQPLGKEAVLADLEYNGGRIRQNTLHLPRASHPYLRLDCDESSQPLHLTAVVGMIGAPTGVEQRQWHQPGVSKAENTEGRWRIEYQLQGRLRVSGLNLAFPEANSWARAVIESRPSLEVPWRQVAAGEFYRLDLQGSPLHNPVQPCVTNTDPWWRLTITTTAYSSQEKLPQLRLGWQADELIFLGRGPGPYTLAFGSGRISSTNGQDSLIRTALQQTDSQARMQQIEPGPVHSLGGEQALQPAANPVPWQRLVLWLVLVAGVALLALMARSIYREMHNKPG